MRIIPDLEVLADSAEVEDGWMAPAMAIPRPPPAAASCPRTPWTEFTPGDESVGEEPVERHGMMPHSWIISSDEEAADDEESESLPSLEPMEDGFHTCDEHVGADPVVVSDDDEPADDAPMPAATAAAAGLQAEASSQAEACLQACSHVFQLAGIFPQALPPLQALPRPQALPVPMPPWSPMPLDTLPAPVASPFSYLPQVPPPPRPQQSSSNPTTPVYQEDPFAMPTPLEEQPPIRRPPSYPPTPFYQQPPPIRRTPSYQEQSPIRRPPSRTQGGSPLAGGDWAPFYGEVTDEVRAKRVIGELRYNARAHELAVINNGWIAFDELRSLRSRSIDELDAIISLLNRGKKRVDYYYHYDNGIVNTVSLRVLWDPKTPWVQWDAPTFPYGQ